jgi:hypothetical protein
LNRLQPSKIDDENLMPELKVCIYTFKLTRQFSHLYLCNRIIY